MFLDGVAFMYVLTGVLWGTYAARKHYCIFGWRAGLPVTIWAVNALTWPLAIVVAAMKGE